MIKKNEIKDHYRGRKGRNPPRHPDLPESVVDQSTEGGGGRLRPQSEEGKAHIDGDKLRNKVDQAQDGRNNRQGKDGAEKNGDFSKSVGPLEHHVTGRADLHDAGAEETRRGGPAEESDEEVGGLQVGTDHRRERDRVEHEGNRVDH